MSLLRSGKKHFKRLRDCSQGSSEKKPLPRPLRCLLPMASIRGKPPAKSRCFSSSGKPAPKEHTACSRGASLGPKTRSRSPFFARISPPRATPFPKRSLVSDLLISSLHPMSAHFYRNENFQYV